MEDCREIKPGRKKFKMALARMIFWFVGRGFGVCASMDSRMRSEAEKWDEGFTVTLKVGPKGPCMTVGKRKGRIKYLGSVKTDDADIIINFKNIEAALLVLTARIGIAGAFAQHRFTLKGDIALGMSVVRCMYIVEAYLFPGFIAKNVLKRVPEKEVSSLKVYASILL